MKKEMPNEDDGCNQISLTKHALAQSLLIIHAYSKGTSERIKENNFDIEEIKLIFKKINEQVEVMGKLIHSLS